MIADPNRAVLLSSLGWVDHDALWRFDVATGTTSVVPLESGARYVSLHHAGSDRFAVAHHFDGSRYQVSVRAFASPRDVLARAVIEDGRNTVTGDPSVWTDVPRLFVEYLAFAPWQDFVLIRVVPAAGGVDIQRLPWFDDSYDKGYQGVVDALELPNSTSALVSVQRSSQLILHDLNTGTKSGEVSLGGRGGNPALALRESGRELWAVDYDTLVVVNTADWTIARSAHLQGSASGTGQFIGDFAFTPEADLCVVARPFSGDVVGLDLRTLAIKRSAPVGREPLQVAAISGDEVVARAWKTGELLRGTLRPVP